MKKNKKKEVTNDDIVEALHLLRLKDKDGDKSYSLDEVLKCYTDNKATIANNLEAINKLRLEFKNYKKK